MCYRTYFLLVVIRNVTVGIVTCYRAYFLLVLMYRTSRIGKKNLNLKKIDIYHNAILKRNLFVAA